MPGDKSKSSLAKKYGQKRVARARDLIKVRKGKKISSTKDNDLPWALIGYIAKQEKKSGKTITRKAISSAKIKTKRKKVEKSLKKNYNQSNKA